jgi:hypothetical protein
VFGVMHYKACSQSDAQREEHRLHYCGTCKTMGALYGQACRFLLNNDAVFLAELLTQIERSQASEPMPEWVNEYRSYNCLTLPGDASKLPLPLMIASDVTMLLAALKLDDQRKDTRHLAWSFAKQVFSATEQEACRSLEERGFPLACIWESYGEQDAIETFVSSGMRGRDSNSVTERVDYCAGPTAAITAIVFKHATGVVGGSRQQQEAMETIGSAFGRLVYLLDAIEDYARDARRRQFNPFLAGNPSESAASCSRQAKSIPSPLLQSILPYARAQFEQVESSLVALSIEPQMSAAFAKRLRDSLTKRLGTGWSACSSACKDKVLSAVASTKHVCTNFGVPWSKRLGFAFTQACRLVHDVNKSKSWKIAWVEPFIFACAWMTAFLFPYFSKQSQTLSQCFSVNLNLIAWGSLISDLLRLPAEAGAGLRPAFAAMSGSSGWFGGGSDDSGGGGTGDGGVEPPLQPDNPDNPGSPGRRRSKRRFGEREPRESPEIKPGSDPMPPSTPSGRWKEPDSYRYRNTSSGPCGDPIACEVCSDGCNCCCQSSECCAGGADCCVCGGGDCCAAGGGDCCAGGGGDCCGGADCGSCDCGGADCGGCSACN